MLIHHYYQTILREDLLLKYSYSHVMILPQLSKLVLQFQSAAEPSDPQSKLILEIVSGQAVTDNLTLSSRSKNASNLLAKLAVVGIPLDTSRASSITDNSKNFRIKLDNFDPVDCCLKVGETPCGLLNPQLLRHRFKKLVARNGASSISRIVSTNKRLLPSAVPFNVLLSSALNELSLNGVARLLAPS